MIEHVCTFPVDFMISNKEFFTQLHCTFIVEFITSNKSLLETTPLYFNC